MAKAVSLKIRILRALAQFPEGKTGYRDLMWAVWPHSEYPRAYRNSSNGGPPGVAMVFGSALRELGEQECVMRPPSFIGGKEERFGQRDVWMMGAGRKLLREKDNER